MSWLRTSRRLATTVGALLMVSGCATAEKTSYWEKGQTYHRPATIKPSQLTGFSKLSKPRQTVITEALALASQHGWLKYKFGGSTPAAGGFDCSGAMYYLLRKSGLKPPRTSAQQFIWLRDRGRIHRVSAASLEDKDFSKLRPGDLLFWSGTYTPTDGRKVKITHVSMYLGQEKDGRHVMAGATKGRSYRGKRGDGYGVYDFKLPRKGSRSKFIGYGTPVGLEK